MSMPKTPMNKYQDPVLWQDNIGPSDQLTNMRIESKTSCMKSLLHLDFRRGILRAISRHDAASGSLVYSIRHMLEIRMTDRRSHTVAPEQHFIRRKIANWISSFQHFQYALERPHK